MNTSDLFEALSDHDHPSTIVFRFSSQQRAEYVFYRVISVLKGCTFIKAIAKNKITLTNDGLILFMSEYDIERWRLNGYANVKEFS